MAMDLLQRLASTRLPTTVRSAEEVDQVKLLRAAGLVIAFTPAPADPLTLSGPAAAAQVLAITPKGYEELARLSPPAGGWSPRTRGRVPKFDFFAFRTRRSGDRDGSRA